MKTKLLNVMSAAILLLTPNVNFGQVVTLGTAADFVLFTSNGAVLNTGFSHLTGNVGTNNGSSTGFGNVNGVMHDGDGASAQAATDLLIAYNQLNAAIPNYFPASLLGNGDTLTPGVYYIGAPASLNLNLYLNAQGDTNAKFIFQIQGAFSTNAGSKIKLINGAMACNVFWKIEGLVDMSTGTTMRGTVVANNAGINMATGDTLEGRALSTTGAVTVSGILGYTPLGCGSPVLTGPIAPTLGSTACYALFSGNGAVSNTGITYVTGDVGTNVGLTTGFDSAYVTGTIHPNPDASTAACANDLTNVYNYLNTLPYDIELLYPAQFGNGLVLTPHTYLLNAATVLTDTLYLNAQGNPDGVFVIKTNGALSTSTFAKVKLINGAQSKNVYWKIEGAADLNDYVTFKGTVVVNGGAVNGLNTGVMVDGRILTTGGALSTNTGTIIATMIPGNCNVSCSGTPNAGTAVASSSVACSGGTVNLNLTGSTAATGLTYQWQSSPDGSIWTSIPSATTMATTQTVTAATYYQNIVSCATNTAASTPVFVNLTSPPVAGTISGPSNVNSGSTNAYTITPTSGNIQWYSGSSSTGPWSLIAGATSASNQTITAASAGTVYYTVIASIPGCANDTANIPHQVIINGGTVGVSKIEAENNTVSIYPNPFSASTNILINDLSQINKAELKLYNVLGEMVLTTTLTKQLTTIETNNLSAGVYFYKVVSNNITIQSGRLISNK